MCRDDSHSWSPQTVICEKNKFYKTKLHNCLESNLRCILIEVDEHQVVWIPFFLKVHPSYSDEQLIHMQKTIRCPGSEEMGLIVM